MNKKTLEELQDLWERSCPSSQKLERWGEEIVAKGEILNILITLFEFLAAITGTMANIIPNTNKKSKI